MFVIIISDIGTDFTHTLYFTHARLQHTQTLTLTHTHIFSLGVNFINILRETFTYWLLETCKDKTRLVTRCYFNEVLIYNFYVLTDD